MTDVKNLLTNKDWSIIDGEPCKVIEFVPFALFEEGKIIEAGGNLPYAVVVIECPKLTVKASGAITHKIDFIHLWMAFHERTIKENEEVIIFWTAKNYKSKVYKILSRFMPKLWVMICPKDSYNILSDNSYRPELTGEKRYLACKPIIEWKPNVFK